MHFKKFGNCLSRASEDYLQRMIPPSRLLFRVIEQLAN